MTGFVAPTGLNIAGAPFGMFDPVSGIIGATAPMFPLIPDAVPSVGTAGVKFVGIATVCPAAVSVPTFGPSADVSGMTCPAFGTKLPLIILPSIGVVAPTGVNIAGVPSGNVEFVKLIPGAGVPTLPTTGFATVGTGRPICGLFVVTGLKFVGTLIDGTPVLDSTPVLTPIVDSGGITDPEFGIKAPFWIVPTTGVYAPAGVKFAGVPFPKFELFSAMTGAGLPTTPVIGFAVVAVAVPRLGFAGVKFVGTPVL